MGDLSGQVAIVTGAASGIGRETARLLACRGARVVGVDITPFDGADAGLEGAIEAVQCDITAPDAAAALAAKAGEGVSILCNVAGIMDGFQAVGEVEDANWDRIMAVNVTAPMRLMRAVLPAMLASGNGAIINVASEAGIKGACAGAAYTSSKHALVGLSKNSAFLYAQHGIRVNVVAPGPVETGLRPDFRSRISAARLPDLLKASISRVAQPEEIAHVIAWLASPQASSVNGAIVAADGGWSAA